MKQQAFIISGYRTAVCKAPKGSFRFTRADDLAAEVIKFMLTKLPQLDTETIDDIIVGNATPEAEQGLNLGRMISMLALNSEKVPGMTVNRYCASGLESIAIAVSKIESGMADCIIAGGVEVMSTLPFGGLKFVPNPTLVDTNPDYYWGMGLTAEEVASQYKISREDQDYFSLQSHQKAIVAVESKYFENQIVPIKTRQNYINHENCIVENVKSIMVDEGPRADTNYEALSKLKPVFKVDGTVTAGNSSQTSDGAAFVMVVSEKKLKELNCEPIAQMRGYAVAGLSPKIMGVGPIYAIPKVLESTGLSLKDINLIELNEAFAAQSLAVIRNLNLDQNIINVNGGAIALGHPLGCTGAKLSIQIFDELSRRNQKFGLVSMCVGSGQGAAAIFEKL